MERILGLFSCDCDQSCRILHGAVHGSHFVYNDVFLRLCLECVFFLLVGGSLTFAGQKNLCWPDCHRSRFDASFMSSPSVDIFMAGFPCQPFSRAGLGHGTLDPRGTVVFRLISWIEVHLPVIFVLENVIGLLERHEDTFVEILELLVKIGEYEISWAVLGAHTHGNVPQHRQRVFICGILREHQSKELAWPNAIPLSTSLSDFMDDDGDDQHDEVVWPTQKTYRRNLLKAYEAIVTTTGENPLQEHYVVDVGCGPSRQPCC